MMAENDDRKLIKRAVDNNLIRYNSKQECVVSDNGTRCEIRDPAGSEAYYKVRIPTGKSKNGRLVRLHEVVGYMKYGPEMMAANMHIHHIDGRHDNNKWGNLQLMNGKDHHKQDSMLETKYKIFQAQAPDNIFIGTLNDFAHVEILAKHIPNLYANELRGRANRNKAKKTIDLSNYYDTNE